MSKLLRVTPYGLLLLSHYKQAWLSFVETCEPQDGCSFLEQRLPQKLIVDGNAALLWRGGDRVHVLFTGSLYPVPTTRVYLVQTTRVN